MSSPTPPAGTAAMPLQPPTTLTLSVPEAPAAVAATQAPAMAPQVEAAQVPVLDAKVDEFLRALDSAEEKSPTFSAQADAVRSMGDADIRKAAETSNRLLNTPVRALKTADRNASAERASLAANPAPRSNASQRGSEPGAGSDALAINECLVSSAKISPVA